jgi:hypothetical protein
MQMIPTMGRVWAKASLVLSCMVLVQVQREVLLLLLLAMGAVEGWGRGRKGGGEGPAGLRLREHTCCTMQYKAGRW